MPRSSCIDHRRSVERTKVVGNQLADRYQHEELRWLKSLQDDQEDVD